MFVRFRSLLGSLLLLGCFAVTSRAAALVNVQLVMTNSEGNPISDITVGDDFFLNAFVQDARGEDAEGVFSSYIDVIYDSTIITPSGPIDHSDFFGNGLSGDLSVLGLVDEAGGFATSFYATGPTDPQLLWTLPMTVIAPGRIEFESNLADMLPLHETLLFDSTDAIDAGDINFGRTVRSVQAVPEPDHVVLTLIIGMFVWAPLLKKRSSRD